MNLLMLLWVNITLFHGKAIEPKSVDLRVSICTTDTTQPAEKIIKTKRYEVKTRGFNFKNIEPFIDSGNYPKSLYFNVRIAEITGFGIQQIKEGKFIARVLNEKGVEMPLPKDVNQYVAKTFKEGEQVNILVSIPLNPVDKLNNKYSIKYRWDDAGGEKYIDITCKISNK